MFEALEKAINQLEDTQAGWVHRRDAAQALGRYARDAAAALLRHRDEPDVDVRREVREALSQALPPGAANAAPAEAPLSFAQIGPSLEKPGRREVRQEGTGWLVEVRVSKKRSQRVRIEETQSQDKRPLMRAETTCGPAAEAVQRWALRTNPNLVHCAFAMRDGAEGNPAEIVLVGNLPLEDATPVLVKRVVKAVAFYGDWLENKISNEDMF